MAIFKKKDRSAPAANSAVALNVTGQREPIEPAYQKNLTPSPVSSQLGIPSEPTAWKAPVVYRGDRTVGMRYLYARGAVAQPISPLGTGPDIGVAVWSSDFQPDLIGPIHDAGFNDALFQAGYPGFNLGLSFKVPVSEKQPTGPGHNMHMKSSNVTTHIQRIVRSGQQSSTKG